jgi:4-amino-4-deoxy-L-arabinose transferase-like glycosyltransferase
VEALIFALIIVGAVSLRLRFLSEGIWGDEGFTYYDIIAPTLHGMIEQIRVGEANPPLFFLLLRGWAHLFGVGETALRSFSLLWSVAAVITTYYLARRCASRSVALGAMFLVATLCLAITYSNNVRPYAMTQCLASLCVLLYDRVLVGGKWRTSAAWVVVSIALIWTHYVGIAVVAALFVTTLIVRPRFVVRPWVLITGYALVAASFLPWLSIAIVQIHSGTPWVVVPTPLQRLAVAFDAIGLSSPFLPWLQWWFGLHIGDLIATMLLLVVAAAAHRMMRCPSRIRSAERSTQERSFTFVVLVLSVVLVLLALTGYRLERYFMPIIPLTCVLYAGLIGQIYDGLSARGYPERGVRWAMVGLVLVIVCLTIATSEEYARVPKSGFRALVADAAPLAADSHVLWIVAPEYAASPVGYYLRNKKVSLHGFARWDEPQLLRVPGYVAFWHDPRLLTNMLGRVNASACSGFTRIALVRPYGLGYIFVDSGKVAYSREHIFEEDLGKRYHLIERRSYARGGYQEASLILFRLRCLH